MAIFNRPDFLDSSTFVWGIAQSGLSFASPHNGTPQTLNFVAERWTVAATLPPWIEEEAGQVEAFALRMAGGVNRVRLHHEARPAPMGTVRGNPTLASTVTRGASVLPVRTLVGKTFKAGDMVGAADHLFMVAEPCVADATGIVNAPLVNRVRSTIAANTPVVWDRPTALFVVPSMTASASHIAVVMESLALDFLEVW